MPETFAQDPVAQAVEIALLKQTVEGQQAALAELTTAVKALTAQVSVMSTTIAEARGGWRMLMLLGGAGAAMGSAATWFLAHVRMA